MQSIYLTLTSMRNHPSQTMGRFSPTTCKRNWQELALRLLSLLIPALLGSLVVGFWLASLNPGSPLDTEPATLPQPVTTQTIQDYSTHTNLLPDLDSLDGLFTLTTRPKPWQTIPPEAQPSLPKPNPQAETTSLETTINQTLLDEMDPLILTREQKQVFINNIPTGYPVVYKGVNSPFGYRTHPTLHGTRFHPGVDLQAPMHTKVRATADGVVEFAGAATQKMTGLSGFGNVIALQHSYGFRTIYSHLSKISAQPGDFVKKGDIIGLSGQSGIATAAHLHYEIRFINQYINPSSFMKWTQEHYAQVFREKTINWKSLVTLIGLRVPKTSTSSPLRVALN